MSCISRGETSHQTGTVPLCSTTGATSSIERTSMPPSVEERRDRPRSVHEVVAEPVTAAARGRRSDGCRVPTPTRPTASTRSTSSGTTPHLNTIEHTTDEIDAHRTRAPVRGDVPARDAHAGAHRRSTRHRSSRWRPPRPTFANAADLEAIRAFVLVPGETVVLHQGTWHWGPFPIRGAVGAPAQRAGTPVRRGQRVGRPQRLADRGGQPVAGTAPGPPVPRRPSSASVTR